MEDFTLKNYALNGSQIKFFIYSYYNFFNNKHVFISVDVQLFWISQKYTVKNHGQVQTPKYAYYTSNKICILYKCRCTTFSDFPKIHTK